MSITYALSDIHGDLDALVRALKWIAQDAAGKQHTIVFCGDYIDRGPDSRGVLDLIRHVRDNPGEGNTVIVIAGNHDYLMVYALGQGNEQMAKVWADNGGTETIKNYLLDPTAGVVDENLDLPAIDDHMEFIQDMDTFYETDQFIFVHAGIKGSVFGGVSMEDQSIETLMWIRPDDMDKNWSPIKKLLIHGHTPMNNAFYAPGRVCLDGGVGMGGRLNVLRIEDIEFPDKDAELNITINFYKTGSWYTQQFDNYRHLRG